MLFVLFASKLGNYSNRVGLKTYFFPLIPLIKNDKIGFFFCYGMQETNIKKPWGRICNDFPKEGK